MLFSSVLFLFYFLPVTLLLYYISPAKLKNTVLLVCSLVFYCWGEVRFFPVMLFVIVVNYVCGLGIGAAKKQAARRVFLILSIIGSLSMLLYFKYFNFFVININTLLRTDLPLNQNLILPLGISFYTFQSMSYSIDVYRRDVPAEKNIINFASYVTMFPQLIAGPIVRYSDINERLHIYKGRVTLARIEEGVTLFIFGLAKKVLVADGVNRLWTDIIGQYGADGSLTQYGVGLANASTGLVWLGMLAYTLYIYFDFSGYSLMGIGLGKMLGFDFPQNFNLPYIAKSVTEFWRRWHITLSSWFREYVYIPLGGNRKGLPRQIFNLFIVWFLTGFWHGANWNFIAWGLYFFVLLVIEKVWLLPKLQKGRIWPHIYTMLVVVVGWALFVGSDPGVSLGLLLQRMFLPQAGVGAMYYLRNYAGILAVGIFFSTALPQKLYDKVKGITAARGVVLAALLVICVAYMAAGGYSPFLYFNF